MLLCDRDAALGVKADVDGLLEGFTTVEGSLSGLEEKVQESLDIVDDISSNLTQVRDGDKHKYASKLV